VLLAVKNKTRGTELGDRVRVATSLLGRALGLLSTATLPSGEGLYLSPCKSIHTFFMRYTIDVLFLDDKGVVMTQCTMAPWKISRWESRCRGILELPAGTLEKTRTQPGDLIDMKAAS
jgi:uncharacterized membrane protein (UPF0127 family)